MILRPSFQSTPTYICLNNNIRLNGDPWQGLLAYAGLGGGGGERKAKCQVPVAVSCDRES